MKKEMRKFGKYFLLDKLAQGGMAEIFRAVKYKNEGNNTLYAIKYIQSGLTGNEEFVNMFKAEMALVEKIKHGNIVSIKESGEFDQQLYIVMDYIDGKNIRDLIRKTTAQEQNQKIPVEFAAYVIAEAAKALQEAYFGTNEKGEQHQVVHRDISPQNILISYRGEVKVIDFGVAKATGSGEHTQAGVIKGKLSYLSPEQCACVDELDGRSDLFALGSVFWELLTGKKLFTGNEAVILTTIQNCDGKIERPSKYNKYVTPDLDAIVLKMLKQNRDERYLSGSDIARDINRYLQGRVLPDDIGMFLKQAFKNEFLSERNEIKELITEYTQLSVLDVPALHIPGQKEEEKPEETTTFVKARLPSPPVEFKLEPAATKIEMELKKPSLPPRTPQQLQSNTYATRTSHSQIKKDVSQKFLNPQHASQYSSQYSNSENSNSVLTYFVAGICALIGGAYFAPQFGYEVPVLSSLLGAVPQHQLNRVPSQVPSSSIDPETAQNDLGVKANSKKVLLKLKVVPTLSPSAEVSVNGTILPVSKLETLVSSGSEVSLKIEQKGYKKFISSFTFETSSPEYTREIVLEADSNRLPSSVAIQGDQYGIVNVKSSSPGVEVEISIDGTPSIQVPVGIDPIAIKVPPGKIKARFFIRIAEGLEDVQEFDLAKGQSIQILGKLR